MAKLNKEVFIETLKNMTLLEIKELVEALKKEFGIDFSNLAPVNSTDSNDVNKSGSEASEQTEFTLILKTFGESKNKIPIMRALRDIYNFNLKDVKEIVETPNKIIKEGISKSDAERVKQQLESLGATVELK
ncbi:MAG: 50S ribosomal protein L7/L12 [Vigna little leaf phytoplasma]|nr:50S ribosomal protein L7/L12 [Vigna little leaf phytoplasma]